MAEDRSKPKRQKAKQRTVAGGITGVRPVPSTTRGSPPKIPQQNYNRPNSKPPPPPSKNPLDLNIHPDTIKFLGDAEIYAAPPFYRRASLLTTVATAAAAADARKTSYSQTPPQVINMQSPPRITPVTKPRLATPTRPSQSIRLPTQGNRL